MSEYQTILVEKRGRVAIITFNRPDALNALNLQLTTEVTDALIALDADDSVGAIVLTGQGKAFAAGADIKEMATKTYAEAYLGNFITKTWEQLTRTRKPTLAAVNGFALGGGCEFAMMCDMAFASENAKFGQPEIKLGVIPGSGGTQRLTRFVGKAYAMDLILTGRMIDAAEALRIGLVSRVYPADQLLDEALKAADAVANFGLISTMAAKEAINAAYETTMAEGVHFERRLFHGLFASEDQKEGMAAFVEKRPANFKHR